MIESETSEAAEGLRGSYDGLKGSREGFKRQLGRPLSQLQRALMPDGKGLKARWEGPWSQQGRALEPAERASEPAVRASEPAWRAPKCQLGRASELGGKGLGASMERPTSRLRSAIVKLLMDHRVNLAYFCGRVGSATTICLPLLTDLP